MTKENLTKLVKGAFEKSNLLKAQSNIEVINFAIAYLKYHIDLNMIQINEMNLTDIYLSVKNKKENIKFKLKFDITFSGIYRLNEFEEIF